MKKLQKITLLLLIVASMCFSVIFTASAAEANLSFTMVADATVVKAGETFTVTIAVDKNDGIYAATLALEYDATQVTFVSADVSVSDFWHEDKPESAVTVSADGKVITIGNGADAMLSPAVAERFTNIGKVAVLTFKANDTAIDGANAAIKLPAVKSTKIMDLGRKYNYVMNGAEASVKLMSANGHTHVWTDHPDGTAKAPTCFVDGYENRQICYCGETQQTDLPAPKAHTPGTPVQTNLVQGDCVTPTTYTLVVRCSNPNCDEAATGGALISETPVSDGGAGHNIEGVEPVKFPISDPKCFADGHVENGSYDLVYYCKVEGCGKEARRENVIIPASHTYEDVVTAPKCGEEGYTTSTCKVCGYSYQHSKVDALEHTGGTAYCYKKAICDLCGKEYGDLLPHNIKNVEAKDPDCFNVGWYAYEYCENEGCPLDGYAAAERPIRPHNPTMSLYVAPSCSTEGKMVFTCSYGCGTTISETILEKTDHDKDPLHRVEPTCTAPGLTEGVKCNACGEILTAQDVIPALGHDEIAHEAKAADCTNIGYEAYVTCSRCDYTTYKEIAALGHKSTVKLDAVAPTCTATGLTEGWKCEVCDVVTAEQRVLAATGHKEVEIPAVAATCTTAGSTAGVKCDTCGEIITAPTTVAALGHTTEVVPGKAATCTATGRTDGEICTVCGETLVAQDIIDALGHTLVVVPAKIATCTEDGLTQGEKCSVCDTVTLEQEVVDALGHIEATIEGKLPTCTETGLTAGKKCETCGEILTAQEEVAALGHDEIAHEAKAANCTNIGWEAYVTCSRCDYTTYKEIAALGHKPTVKAPAVAPTCTKPGLTEGWQCEVCDEFTTEQYVVAATHDAKIIPAVPATCLTAGSTEGAICHVCGEILVAVTEVPALGHDEIAHEAKAANCTNIGYEAYVTCSRCDYTTYKEIAALGHKATVKLDAVAPTCTATGLTEGWKCEVCDAVTAEQRVLAATGHKEVEIPAVAATCTTAGSTAGVKCDTCGEIITAPTTVAALGHTTEVVPGKAATCTATGRTDGEICTVCGDTLVAQDIIDALGHTYKLIPGKPATCTATGLHDGFECETCGILLVAQEVKEALGHDAVSIPAVAPTCTEKGKTEGKKCDDCGEILVAQEDIAALGHKAVDDAATEADCTTAGLTAGKHCFRCGIVLTAQDIIPAKGHSEVEDAAVAPTCSSTGLTAGKHCTVCGTVTVAQEVVPALDHTVVVDAPKAPTCTETGLTEGKHCSVCNAVIVPQSALAALGHNEEILPAVEPTWNEDGITEGKKCSVCNHVFTAQEIVPATGIPVWVIILFIVGVVVIVGGVVAIVLLNKKKKA